ELESSGGVIINSTKELDARISIGDASLFDTTSGSLYGIDANFLDVIYEKFSFSLGNLNDIKDLTEGEVNTVIISTALVKDFSLQKGDPLHLQIDGGNATYDYLNLTVKAALNAAPGFSGFSTSSGFFSGSDVLVSQATWSKLREIIHSEKDGPFGDLPIERIFFKIEDPETGPDPKFELDLSIKLGEFLSIHYPDSDNDVTLEEVEDAKAAARSGQTLFSTIMSLAVIISFFGLISSMYSSVQESQFEIGVMKSMGLKNSDVRNYLIFESTILTLSSGACGAVIGYILAYTFEFQTASFGDSPIIFVVPWFLLTFLFVTSIVVGVLGAVIPGRIVVRKSPVEILRRA
ncbi:MAG: FtsX-like permease family protein, partial [Candidatus Heimdallarchaeota archaeon]